MRKEAEVGEKAGNEKWEDKRMRTDMVTKELGGRKERRAVRQNEEQSKGGEDCVFVAVLYPSNIYGHIWMGSDLSKYTLMVTLLVLPNWETRPPEP